MRCCLGVVQADSSSPWPRPRLPRAALGRGLARFAAASSSTLEGPARAWRNGNLLVLDKTTLYREQFTVAIRKGNLNVGNR